MVDSIRKQLQYPVDGIDIAWSHLAVDKISRNRGFFLVQKTGKLMVSEVETNSQQQSLELVLVE
jgi:hypothetical protein